MAIAKIESVVLDCREPEKVAEFYGAIIGAKIEQNDADWVQLERVDGLALAFQLAPDHIPPQWPKAEHPQQFHVDLLVPDLDAGEQKVLALGARKHEYQPRPTSFRVFLDPAGHPFCLVR